MILEPIYRHVPDVYEIPGFTPHIIDRAYLKALGVSAEPDQDTVDGLIRGSESFIARLKTKTVIPTPSVAIEKIDLGSELEIHNYTQRCPTLTYEVTPVKGCLVGCLYCLVTDGVHEQPLIAYENYHELLALWKRTRTTSITTIFPPRPRRFRSRRCKRALRIISCALLSSITQNSPNPKRGFSSRPRRASNI